MLRVAGRRLSSLSWRPAAAAAAGARGPAAGAISGDDSSLGREPRFSIDSPFFSAARGMQKYHGSTQSAPFGYAPFALRGALDSSNSSFSSIDGLRQPFTSFNQAKGHTSFPLGAGRTDILPGGNRALHTSQPLFAPVSNRPLSPHLPLKKPQLSATYSISHRIFGVALGAAIISIPLATRFSLMFDI